ncbi:hypothetical protein HQ584_09295 [Patescibacteria group bacterium]|nr:hypothetical protein [Patescibacteria group bacterium]
MSVIGLDLGTTVCKASLFNDEGNLIFLERKEYPVISPYPGWAEQNPEEVWKTVKDVLKITATHSRNYSPPEAICISAQGEAVVFLDENLKPLRRNILGMDMRSVNQVEKLKEKFGKDWLYKLSGVPAHPITTLAKVLWVKEEQANIFRQTSYFLCYEDFISMKLGGIAAIDYSLACRTMMFDIERKEWSSRILDYLQINPDNLAKIYPSGEIIGKIFPKIAREIGLPSGVKLVTGGHDVTCAALGAGSIREGIAADIVGTAEIFGITLENREIALDIQPPNFACYLHVVPHKFWLMTLNQTCGLLLKWYRDTFGQREAEEAMKQGIDVFSLIVNQAKKDPANILILPHLVGSGTPWIDAKSKGAILGLTINTDKSEVIRAIMEAVVYEQKINLDIFEAHNLPIREIRAVGGGTKSKTWLQVRADILNKTITTVHTDEASCLGTAILAQYALGKYFSIQEAAKKMVKVRTKIIPNRTYTNDYKQRYQLFNKIYPTLKQINHLIHNMQRKRKY